MAGTSQTQRVRRKSSASSRARKASPATGAGTKEIRQPESRMKPEKRKVGLSLNWNRAIYINKLIDDALLRDLTPIILQMKQESSEPITIGIDSPGGRIEVMESLLSLLKAPDQDGRRIDVHTAATNRAYSAAASFLAFGDYSVSFPHSKILYHDVRYSDMEDITPTKALEAARRLERSNAVFSLRLANHIRGRLIWVYIDLKGNFQDVRKRWPKFVEEYDKKFKELLPEGQSQTVDVVGLALALYSKLSKPVDRDIAIQALQLLDSWTQIERIEQKVTRAASEGGKPTDIAEGINSLIEEIRRMNPERQSEDSPVTESKVALDESIRSEIRLLLEVLARRIAVDKIPSLSVGGLDLVMEDFTFMKDLNSQEHIRAITKMMVEHDTIFFGRPIAEELQKAKDDGERNRIIAPFYPQARMFWYYIVLVCRCLCRGDHFLTPYDAQLLGLVDEVLGGGHIQSKREWRKTRPEEYEG